MVLALNVSRKIDVVMVLKTALMDLMNGDAVSYFFVIFPCLVSSGDNLVYFCGYLRLDQ